MRHFAWLAGVGLLAWAHPLAADDVVALGVTARLDFTEVIFEVDAWEPVTAVRVTLRGGAVASDVDFLLDGTPVVYEPDFWTYVDARAARGATASR